MLKLGQMIALRTTLLDVMVNAKLSVLVNMQPVVSFAFTLRAVAVSEAIVTA